MKDFKPMLAHVYTDENQIDWSQPVYMQPKLDGVRCIFTKDGAFSRTGKRFRNVKHIEEELQELFKQQPRLILDGELYNHKLKNDFEKIISLVRKQKPTREDMSEARKLVQFHCYDIVDETLPFSQRNDFILKAVYNNYDYVKVLPCVTVNSHNFAIMQHKINLKAGFEGSILRSNNVFQCKRSHALRKFKDFSDAEATIVGYLDGKGKRTGTLGKFIMQDDNGVEFGCPPGKGYTYKQLGTMLENIGDYIGQRATFTFFERTKAGSYRHPLFKCIRNYE